MVGGAEGRVPSLAVLRMTVWYHWVPTCGSEETAVSSTMPLRSTYCTSGRLASPSEAACAACSVGNLSSTARFLGSLRWSTTRPPEACAACSIPWVLLVTPSLRPTTRSAGTDLLSVLCSGLAAPHGSAEDSCPCEGGGACPCCWPTAVPEVANSATAASAARVAPIATTSAPLRALLL